MDDPADLAGTGLAEPGASRYCQLEQTGRQAARVVPGASQTSRTSSIATKRSAPLLNSHRVSVETRPADTSWQSSIREPLLRATHTWRPSSSRTVLLPIAFSSMLK